MITTGETQVSEPAGDQTAGLKRLVEHAAHLLPAQGPIEVFVHHNTLHAFEEFPFHEAVRRAHERFGANPYFPEATYREFLETGRITVNDLDAVLREQLGEHESEMIDGLGTRRQIRLAMLRQPLRIGPDAELRWVIAETDALERFRPEVPVRVRKQMLENTRRWLIEHADSTNPAGGIAAELVGDLLTEFGQRPENWRERTWETVTLQLLWRICRRAAADAPAGRQPQASRLPASSPRNRDTMKLPRDILLQATGEDINRYVHDVLIRFCGVFLDQGYAGWTLPDRDRGLYQSFLALYSQPRPVPDPWMRGLREELQSLQRESTSPEESIAESLNLLGIAENEREEFLTRTLQSLRGWAGMIWQMETAAEWAVRPAPEGSLIGYLAVQLILERYAIAYVGQEWFGHYGSLPEILQTAAARLPEQQPLNVDRRAFPLFQVGQMLGWQPETLLNLSRQDWAELTEEIEAFSSLERRQVFHEAYERQYRVAALDAFANHSRKRQALRQTAGTEARPRPSFQIVCCIDEREESFRRHLEELAPDCETLGAAGFFGVAMKYQGVADAHFKPLCPVSITPQHYVTEDVGYTFQGEHIRRSQARRRLGRATLQIHTRSRAFLGGVVTGILGSLATFPMVARVLFPRLTARLRSRVNRVIQPPPVTQLQLERYREPPGPQNGHVGYTLDEMTGIVSGLLRGMGLTRSFSRIVVICGHGSSSWNNPHEAAHDCGACGGARGGPNARAFAHMANDWRVRARLADQGILIPEDTVFLGSYHNTCDESVVWYDLDRLPPSHRDEFESMRQVIDQARMRNAQERCRRFQSAPLGISPEEALAHVEARAEDLSQVRPEYGHATNAICCVGRRDWSRGLFLDRRAFLTSYDSTQDDTDCSILDGLLQAVIPVCAGINLEYYFSVVDPVRYGCGTKLPHNIVSLLGVMNGSSSDLQPGLPWQMVEIHEPVRLLFVIETTPAAMLAIMDRHEGIGRLCRGGWVQLAVIDPETSTLQLFRNGAFTPCEPSTDVLPEAATSAECSSGSRDHLPFCSIRETAPSAGTPDTVCRDTRGDRA